jgi:hypothetical protein
MLCNTLIVPKTQLSFVTACPSLKVNKKYRSWDRNLATVKTEMTVQFWYQRAGCGDAECCHLAQAMFRWRALVKGEGFLIQLNDCQLLKNDSAPPNSLVINFLSTNSTIEYWNIKTWSGRQPLENMQFWPIACGLRRSQWSRGLRRGSAAPP